MKKSQTGQNTKRQFGQNSPKTRPPTKKARNTGEIRYRLLFNSVKEGILILDHETGTIIDVNPSFTALTGYPIKSLLGKKLRELNLFPDKEFETVINETENEGYASTENLSIHKKDGKITKVEFVCNTYLEDGHKVIQCNMRDIEKGEQKQEALRISEMRFRQISESTRELIWEVDLNGLYTYVNPTTKDILGYAPNELIGKKHFFDFFESEKKEELKKQIFEIFTRNETINNFINCNIHKDGHKICLSTSGFPILDIENKVIGYRGVDRDITAQLKTEESLRQSEVKTKTILEAISTGIMIVDPKTHIIVDVNAEAARLFGESKDKIIGKICHKFICPAEEDKCPITEFEKKIDNTERILINSKGQHIQVLKTVTLIDIGGQKLLLENFTDITKQKNADDNLRWEKDRYKAIINAIPDLIFRLDRQGRFLDYKASEKDLAVQTGDIIGKLNRDIMPPEFAELVEEKIKETLKTREIQTFEYQMDVPGKGMRYYNARMVPSGKEEIIAFVRDITEQKQAQEALRQSEAQLSLVFNNSEDMLLLVEVEPDNRLRIVAANKSYLNLIDLFLPDRVSLKDNIVGMYRDELLLSLGFSRAQFESEDKYFNSAIENKKRIQYEQIIPLPTRIYMDNIIVPVVNPEGRCTHLLYSMRNITERKLAEERIQKSEHRYRELFENSGAAIWEADISETMDYLDAIKEKGIVDFRKYFDENKEELIHSVSSVKLLDANKEILSFLNADSKEQATTGLLDFFTEESFETVKEVLLDLVQGKSKIDGEIPVKTLTNETKHVIFRLSVEPKEEDSSAKSLISFIDITAKKEADESLKLFRTLIDNSNDAIEVIDIKTGQYLDVNKKACSDLGYTREELLNMKVFDIDPNQTFEVFKQSLKEFSKSDSNLIETTHVRKDGSVFPVEVNVTVVELEKTYAIAVVRDITERKNDEQELIKAKNKAEESDRLKSAFLANMSHEIRTPMNGILGFTELLKEPMLSGEEKRKYIDIIEKSGTRMLNIINDIISISKIEAGQVEISIGDTNINDQLEYIHVFFKKEAEQKNLNFVLKNLLPKEDTVIRTDREKIYAILINLVKNALKFTSQGSIEFGCIKKDEFLEFFVKDTGSGIEETQREIIFERFIQGSEALDRDYEGAGLGLAISKGYIEMLGGKIWVTSNIFEDPVSGDSYEKGSAFYFTIPIHQSKKSKAKDSDILTNGITEERNIKLKVLIVEDDEVSLMLIRKMANQFSKEIITATNGKEAVEACRNNPDLDLILMDIKMPMMDGYEASKAIRAFNKKVIIIAQTAYGMVGDREKALKAGCNDYISKPINRTDLYEMLDKHFK